MVKGSESPGISFQDLFDLVDFRKLLIKILFWSLFTEDAVAINLQLRLLDFEHKLDFISDSKCIN